MGPPLPPAVRPLQHQYLQSMSSKDLQPALEAMVERCSGPREALGLSPAAATTAHSGESCARGGGPEAQHEAGLLQLFGWFLTMMDGLLAGWQLSWNRRFRVSTWHGQLQQQPFTRPFLVPVEDPFDPADNAAKAFGCEVGAEVGRMGCKKEGVVGGGLQCQPCSVCPRTCILQAGRRVAQAMRHFQ